MLKGIDKVNFGDFFELTMVKMTRGHSYKLNKSRSHCEQSRNFFTQRVVNSWNNLPQHIVDATTVNEFKNRLDK